MKSILLSVRPKWVEKILNGEKTIEVRKSAPKELPFKVYVYCTKEKFRYTKEEIYANVNYDWADYYKLKGKVVAEFACNKVEKMGRDTENGLVFSNGYNAESCLDLQTMIDYIGNNYYYGWHISDLKVYDTPLELKEFYKPLSDKDLDEGNYDLDCFGEVLCMDQPEGSEYCQDCEYGGAKPITRPPQSWQYIRRRDVRAE